MTNMLFNPPLQQGNMPPSLNAENWIKKNLKKNVAE